MVNCLLHGSAYRQMRYIERKKEREKEKEIITLNENNRINKRCSNVTQCVMRVYF